MSTLSTPSVREVEAPRLVTQPREHFLRQNEARIVSLALPQNNADPVVAMHLDAVQMAEDLESIHTSAVERWEREEKPRFAAIHERHRQASMQFRFYHLDKLAIILI